MRAGKSSDYRNQNDIEIGAPTLWSMAKAPGALQFRAKDDWGATWQELYKITGTCSAEKQDGNSPQSWNSRSPMYLSGHRFKTDKMKYSYNFESSLPLDVVITADLDGSKLEWPDLWKIAQSLGISWIQWQMLESSQYVRDPDPCFSERSDWLLLETGCWTYRMLDYMTTGPAWPLLCSFRKEED